MVTFTWEPLVKLLADGLDRLAFLAWAEVEGEKGSFPFSINWQRYQAMEDAETLRFLAARKDGALVGYAAIVVMPHLRSRSVVMASVADIFVLPEARKQGIGVSLVEEMESWLEKIGVHCVTVAERDSIPTGKFYQRRGYTSNERLWVKQLRVA
jgi:GNAT superfamily N-acetyltransferase